MYATSVKTSLMTITAHVVTSSSSRSFRPVVSNVLRSRSSFSSKTSSTDDVFAANELKDSKPRHASNNPYRLKRTSQKASSRTIPDFESHFSSATTRHRKQRKQQLTKVKQANLEKNAKTATEPKAQGRPPKHRLQNPSSSIVQSSSSLRNEFEPVLPGHPRKLLDVPNSSPTFENSAVSVHRRARFSPSLSSSDKNHVSTSVGFSLEEGGSSAAQTSATAKQRRARNQTINEKKNVTDAMVDPSKNYEDEPSLSKATDNRDQGGLFTFVKSLFGNNNTESEGKVIPVGKERIKEKR